MNVIKFFNKEQKEIIEKNKDFLTSKSIELAETLKVVTEHFDNTIIEKFGASLSHISTINIVAIAALLKGSMDSAVEIDKIKGDNWQNHILDVTMNELKENYEKIRNS